MVVPPTDPYGYVKISRKAYETDPFWNEPRVFSRWEAWEYLIQEASYAGRKWSDGQGIVSLTRGETRPLSIRHLSNEWRWSVKKVRVFLDLIQEDDRIRAHQETPQGHTYVLVNYDVYQGEGHSKGTAKGTAGAQQGHNTEEGKEGEEQNRSGSDKPNTDSAVREVFEHWQETSGHNRAKLTTDRRQKIRARLRTFSADELKEAIANACSDPFYQGDNDRGTRYDWIETLLKNDAAVDRHLNSDPPSPNGSGHSGRHIPGAYDEGHG